MLRTHNFILLDLPAHVLAYLAFHRLETIVSSSATGDLSLGCVLGQISASGKYTVHRVLLMQAAEQLEYCQFCKNINFKLAILL